MNLPRLTMDVTAGSDAAQRNPGCVNIPARPSDAGQVAFTKRGVAGRGAAREAEPGNSVASRLFTQTLCELTRSSTVPDGFVQSTSFTNFCVDV